MIAVPAHAAADMEEQLRAEGEHGGDLIGDGLGGMEVAGVEADHQAIRERVTEVELVGADHEGLAAEAEELALHRVAQMRGVVLHVVDLIEGGLQERAVAGRLHRQFLRAVGNPEVVHRRRAELLPHRRGDRAAALDVLDPEGAGCSRPCCSA